MAKKGMQAAALIAAWFPIFVFWMILTIVYGRMSAAQALPRAVLSIGTAAVLGLGVWRFCLRTPWPQKLRARFYVSHCAAASAYAALWIFGMYASESLLSGTPIAQELAETHVLGWQAIMALWVYGMIAGISYALQIESRARDQERRALQAESGLTAARLDAIRARLHPHFLFNALHTVGALVRRDPAQAESAIEKLGDMLRYTLRDPQGDTVPFAEEWEFTRRYLDFEQLRYGDRLKVAAEIDPACLVCSAPSFALQTLVENAVRHSIGTRPEGGTIEIRARANGSGLLLTVRDDGAGSAPAGNGSRFGLQALRERLLAVYGPASRLAVASGPSGFEVSLQVPCGGGGTGDED
jgi:two-component system LytT family sensor kinase